MSLDIWMKRGKKISIGGRDLYLMPLPLSKLHSVLGWLEENSQEVLNETVKSLEPGKIPNPLVLVSRVMMRVDMSKVALDVFSFPKNPHTKEPVNPDLTKEFFDEYLDIPTANNLVKEFVSLNDLPELIKNLQSLPVVRKIMEVAQLTFGIPFLSSLPQSTDSPQGKLEGSRSLKSTDTSMHSISEEQVFGKTEKQQVM